MAIIIMAAKVMGLLRETLVARLYGQGMESDMINTATQIPLLFFDIVLGVAILSTFVPIFNKYLEKDGKEKAMRFADNFTSIVGLIAIIAAVLGMIFAKQLVHVMVPGYADVPVRQKKQLRFFAYSFLLLYLPLGHMWRSGCFSHSASSPFPRL